MPERLKSLLRTLLNQHEVYLGRDVLTALNELCDLIDARIANMKEQIEYQSKKIDVFNLLKKSLPLGGVKKKIINILM